MEVSFSGLKIWNLIWYIFLANEANSKSASDLALSNLDQNDVDNLPEVTDNDLYSVFSFCKLLPRLEEMGKVKPKKESREVCSKLIDMLQPMFKKKSDSSMDIESSKKRRKRKGHHFVFSKWFDWFFIII